MADCAKRSRIEDYESENSDSPIGMIQEATGGLDSGEESKLDRLLENGSDISR